jgi:hypothetical protein
MNYSTLLGFFEIKEDLDKFLVTSFLQMTRNACDKLDIIKKSYGADELVDLIEADNPLPLYLTLSRIQQFYDYIYNFEPHDLENKDACDVVHPTVVLLHLLNEKIKGFFERALTKEMFNLNDEDLKHISTVLNEKDEFHDTKLPIEHLKCLLSAHPGTFGKMESFLLDEEAKYAADEASNLLFSMINKVDSQLKLLNNFKATNNLNDDDIKNPSDNIKNPSEVSHQKIVIIRKNFNDYSDYLEKLETKHNNAKVKSALINGISPSLISDKKKALLHLGNILNNKDSDTKKLKSIEDMINKNELDVLSKADTRGEAFLKTLKQLFNPIIKKLGFQSWKDRVQELQEVLSENKPDSPSKS